MKTEYSARFKCCLKVTSILTFTTLYVLMFMFFGALFGYALSTGGTIITDNDENLPVLTLMLMLSCVYFSSVDEFDYREIVKQFGRHREPRNGTGEDDASARVIGQGRSMNVNGTGADKKSKTE